jgi:hypothetical protein
MSNRSQYEYRASTQDTKIASNTLAHAKRIIDSNLSAININRVKTKVTLNCKRHTRY